MCRSFTKTGTTESGSARWGKAWTNSIPDPLLQEPSGQTRRPRESAPRNDLRPVLGPREPTVGGHCAGLARLDPKSSPQRRFERIAADPSALGGVAVLTICESTATPGVLWIGTAQRNLCRLEVSDGKCRFITKRDSDLPDNTIYGILADRRGRLWMSTNRALVCYDPATGTFRTYGPQHGLQSNEFNGRAYCRGADGEMFFGGVGG